MSQMFIRWPEEATHPPSLLTFIYYQGSRWTEIPSLKSQCNAGQDTDFLLDDPKTG